MATMVTMARDLLMKPLPLAPTLTLQLTPGMVTMARDLLTKLPLLNLAPTPTPKPTPGMVTTALRLWLPWSWIPWLLLGIKSGHQEQHPIFPCRLICKTPVFAKQFSFFSFEKQFCFVY